MLGNRLRVRRRSAVVALALLVSSCSAPPAPEDPHPSITVASDSRVVSQVLAHLYAGALRAAGARTDLAPAVGAPGAVIDEIAAGNADFYAGFTGELLDTFDGSAAVTADEEVYSALGRALPAWLTVTDQAMAQLPRPANSMKSVEAAGSGERAQHVVPLLRSTPLARRLDDALAVVAGDLTTADLTSMVAKVGAGEPVDRVAGDWVAGRGL